MYLYSLSCRIATGSNPWGFCTGVMRFCFCCIWSIEDPCWPGGWGATELPAIGRAGTTEAWGGAGDGRPLAAGARCFWAFPWPSPPWTADTKYCYYYCMIIVKPKVKIDTFFSIWTHVCPLSKNIFIFQNNWSRLWEISTICGSE